MSLGDMIRRTDSRDLIFELRPGVRGRFLGTPLKINSQGFRGRPVTERPAERALRIVGIGDSIAFGWAVSEKDTFLSYLERRFRREHPGAPPLQVINLAVPGYNTHQEVETFVTKGLSYDPDVVVVYLCGNDDQLPNFIWRRDPYTLRSSYLIDLVRERLRWAMAAPRSSNLRHTARQQSGQRGTTRSNDPDQVPSFFRHMVGMDAVVHALSRLARVAGDRGIPVVYAGWRSELEDRIRPTARALGFTVVDGIPERTRRFLEASGRSYDSLLVSPTDGHPNREFHALIGAGIYEEAIRPWYDARAPRRDDIHTP
jgi:GDSL-like Lipase/Acylhydrolase family